MLLMYVKYVFNKENRTPLTQALRKKALSSNTDTQVLLASCVLPCRADL
jgi:hypothetical protein